MQVAIPKTLFAYSSFNGNVEDIVQHNIETYFEDAKIVLATDRQKLIAKGGGEANTEQYLDLLRQGYVYLCFADKMQVQGKQNDYVIVVKPTAAVTEWFKAHVGRGVGSVSVTEPAGSVVFKSDCSQLSTSHLAGSVNLDDYHQYINSVE